MNCPTVDISFYDYDLNLLLTTTNIILARWSRTVNHVGKCVLDVPARNTGLSFEFLSQRDLVMSIQISEDVGSPVELEGNTVWFLVKFREYYNKNECYFRLTFEDSLTLLDRRIVSERFDNSRDGTSRTLLLGSAGSEMVRVVDNFVGDSAPNDKSLAPRLTTSNASFTSPQIEKNVSFRRLFGVLQQVAAASKTQGVPLYFDLLPVIRDGKISFDFQVYKNQLGRDLTEEVIDTTHPHFILDYFEINYDVANVGYVSGGGRSEDRQVAESIASEATASPFSRRESFKFSTAYSLKVLETEADALIAEASGSYRIKGNFVGSLYRKFNFGDRLRLIHRNILLDVYVSSTSGRLEEQQLTRELTLTSL